MSPRTFSVLPLPAIFLIGLVSCGDPVLDARIEALGGEANGVEPGPFHRPGQPCVLCHSTYGGAEPQLSVGGTIFAKPTAAGENPLPVDKVKVTLVDAAGESPPGEVITNCIGNFYVTKEQWNPLFPLHVDIAYTIGGETRVASMGTRISRDGSCATCHNGAPNQGSAGWVYCTNDPATQFPPVAPDCQGLPKK